MKKKRRTEAPYTIQRLKEALDYNPETGIWKWLIPNKFCKRRVGTKAGMRCKSGYNNIKLDGTDLRASNVAWFYMTGEWPKKTVDHINRIRHDDRWENLRLASGAEQVINRVSKKKSGLPPGVCKHYDKYKVRVTVDYKQHHIGLYDSPEEAHKAYLEELVKIGRSEFLPK